MRSSGARASELKGGRNEAGKSRKVQYKFEHELSSMIAGCKRERRIKGPMTWLSIRPVRSVEAAKKIAVEAREMFQIILRSEEPNLIEQREGKVILLQQCRNSTAAACCGSFSGSLRSPVVRFAAYVELRYNTQHSLLGS
ncbi:hypothetical protein K438DRAFT_1765438 [Mycena galopus ATCC 62051]|nr:hypothetical protein K438DRAFT_1765438 [Mycena galopus ATCC 62051]